jgi:pilus assembly protein CpaF
MTDQTYSTSFDWGPIAHLMSDDSISELMVVAGRHVWVEKGGVMIRSGVRLCTSDTERMIEQAISPLGLHVDRSNPMADARLPDGSRLNVVVPPIAVDGPAMTIRKFSRRQLSIDSFCGTELAGEIQSHVQSRANIVVSGATGSGKTSLLNAMTRHLPRDERVVTIEETAELQLNSAHVVRLETRVSNCEGIGEVTMRQLVRNAMRMRPDRIVVGEVRGGEALDMLQAMHTGHRGSLSTCHANSADDALGRLETMACMSNVPLSGETIHRQVVSAIDYVIHLEDRQVVQILGVRSLEPAS